jgi:hypothetical protein
LKILFSGKKRSGKDTAAAYFKAWYGGEIYSFAKPLYDIMYAYQDAIGVPRHKDRDFLKMLGDYGRKTNPNIWIDLCFASVNARSPKINSYITDGRYKNELDGGRREGFIVVQIVADDTARRLRLDPDDTIDDSHSSESGFPADYPFAATLDNSHSIALFHKELDLLAKRILAGEIK